MSDILQQILARKAEEIAARSARSEAEDQAEAETSPEIARPAAARRNVEERLTSQWLIWVGALAVALAEGKSLIEAVRFGSAAAALSVTRLGAQTSAPVRKEIEKLLTSGNGSAGVSRGIGRLGRRAAKQVLQTA